MTTVSDRMHSDERAISTSGSFLVIFIGLFLALGTLTTVASNTSERVADAGTDQLDHHVATQETSLNVTAATWETDETLELRVNNTGSTDLSVNETTVLVDGRYVSMDAFDATVDGTSTDVWGIEQQLVLRDDGTVADRVGTPSRVKVVTDTGVADTAPVVVL